MIWLFCFLWFVIIFGLFLVWNSTNIVKFLNQLPEQSFLCRLSSVYYLLFHDILLLTEFSPPQIMWKSKKKIQMNISQTSQTVHFDVLPTNETRCSMTLERLSSLAPIFFSFFSFCSKLQSWGIIIINTQLRPSPTLLSEKCFMYTR